MPAGRPAASEWEPRLRAGLRAAGYTPDALRHLLGIAVPDDIGVLNHSVALERIRAERTFAASLVRLFFLEVDEPYRAVAAALSRPLCNALVDARMLGRRGANVYARVRIDPVGEQHVIADRRFRPRDARALRLPGADPVYPPSSDSLLLRDVIHAAAPRQVLDLCTGSGVQALQQAAHAERVVAVDINPRAAALARLNAVVNGVGNMRVAVGDLYAPVRRDQFDLIIANPPFVSSPYADAPAYHSGGPRGDRVLHRILAGLGTHLHPEGRAFAISHVGVRAGEDLATVAMRWFRGFPGRGLVLTVETGTPVDLAAAQALFALERGLAVYAREVRRWVAHLHRQRIAAVKLILIAAERGTGRGVEVIDAPQRVLPIPLSPPPADRIAAWLNGKGPA